MGSDGMARDGGLGTARRQADANRLGHPVPLSAQKAWQIDLAAPADRTALLPPQGGITDASPMPTSSSQTRRAGGTTSGGRGKA